MKILSFAVVRSGCFVLISVLCLAFAWTSAARAQSTFEFQRFAIEGNARIEESTILSIVGLPAGQPLSADEVNAALERVLASDFFETAEFIPQGGTLVIRVLERPTINRVNIEGNRRLDDGRLRDLIVSAPRQVFIPDQAEADARAIINAYEAAGRFNATVRPSIIRRNDNRVDLVFEVAEGGVVPIERISFVGNREFTDRRLRRVLSTKQAGVFRALVGRDSFVADRLSLDEQLLTDFYRSRGYIDFRVLDITSEFSRERNATFITISVREGQPFTFNEISVASELPEVDPADYRDVVRIRSGQNFSPVDIQSSIDRLERRATDNQLDFIRVEPVITRAERDLTLDVEFRLVRAPRIFVERIDIRGNQTTVDQVIRRQFDAVEGDPFNPREISRSADRIRALGFFETVAVNSRQGSSSDQVIVDVEVEEQPTGSLSFGANYSLESGIGFSVGFSERNFLGRGQTLSFDVQGGTEDQESQITFIEPAFLGRDLRFRFSAFYEETDFDNVDYNTRRIGIGTSLGFAVADNTRLQLDYGLSEDTIFGVAAGASPVIAAEAGTLVTSSVGYTFSYDTRRTGLDPRAGVLLSFGQEIAGLGGDNTFVRTSVRGIAQREILNEEVTLRTTFDGGALNFLDGDSRVIDRFTTSSSRLRGFASRGIGPRDFDAASSEVLGGNFFSVVGVEAEFPIGLPDEYGVTGGVFFNAGSVWGLDNTDGAGGIGSIDDDFELRSAIGFSLFWSTPIGPLRLDFSRPVDRNSADETQSFNLSVQANF